MDGGQETCLLESGVQLSDRFLECLLSFQGLLLAQLQGLQVVADNAQLLLEFDDLAKRQMGFDGVQESLRGIRERLKGEELGRWICEDVFLFKSLLLTGLGTLLCSLKIGLNHGQLTGDLKSTD